MYERHDGGRLVAKTLAASGVENLFCLQGGHIDSLLYGCLNEGIRVVDTRHEQAAAHMAEGWALATAEAGVCAVTAGPGLSDAVTGLANAYMSQSPMLLLSGARPIAHADTWPLQDLRQLDMVRPVTKWARVCATADRCGEYTAMALSEARGGRPGPTYLELPLDVVFKETPEGTPITAAVTPAAPAPDPKGLDAVADVLRAAERPIAVVGSGAHWARAGTALATLAETVGLPVFSVNAGRGVLPDTHEWSFGPALPIGGAYGDALAADVVLVLGARLGFTLLNGAMFRTKTVIRVDIDPAETGRNLPGVHNLVSDARLFCEELARGWEGGVSPARAEWGERLREAATRNRRSMFDGYASAAEKPVHPLHLVKAIEDAAGPDATLVADGGDIMTWSMLAFTARGPGRLISISTYLGCLGVGIPFALAAKLARPESPVFLLEGDGAFGLNAMEFDTAVRHGIPIVCLVGNDGSWGMSRHGQGIMFGYDQHVAVDLGVRPYHEVVRALGGHGEFVDSAGELPGAIERALASGLPACINVGIDPSVCSPMTAAMAAAGLS
ncbi:MAG: thiamine pyrophosphate-binding protein [Acidimicrobiia bacterium]|nr:thiamine pyrophosphate-binding protein [Acidimicrobiia bacterium]